jgi:cohesin complex subunit SCC1
LYLLRHFDALSIFTTYSRDVDFEERTIQPQAQHVARLADITLTTTDDFALDLDDPGYGFDLGPSDGIGSQDFDLDLGLDFGDGPVSVNGNEEMSVEVGRDAAAPRLSLDSNVLGDHGMGVDLDIASNRSKSRGASEHPFGPDMDIDFGADLGGVDLDLGLDFGDKAPLSEHEKTPGQTRTSSRACK